MVKLLKKSLLISIMCGMTLIDFSSLCNHGPFGSQNTFFYRTEASGLTPSFARDMPPPISTAGASAGASVSDLRWQQLEDVSYQLQYNKKYGMQIHYPVFGESVKKLSGKTVKISGYMIPFDMEEGLYAISRNTYAACFFCGAAGVESVISVKFKGKPPRYKTDQYCTMLGRLELNSTNVDDFIYILHETEELKN